MRFAREDKRITCPHCGMEIDACHCYGEYWAWHCDSCMMVGAARLLPDSTHLTVYTGQSQVVEEKMFLVHKGKDKHLYRCISIRADGSEECYFHYCRNHDEAKRWAEVNKGHLLNPVKRTLRFLHRKDTTYECEIAIELSDGTTERLPFSFKTEEDLREFIRTSGYTIK